ncbi:expressed hypothetical protein [Apostichopus japonicus]|uniref:Ig-like domain-containing protein n=1 Tax=Stichopus japonicus TaxID=307972 RepID=A0A2G8KSS6_STIJA|nr:expressed hypothetical protein [Apostichopus japonicus]
MDAPSAVTLVSTLFNFVQLCSTRETVSFFPEMLQIACFLLALTTVTGSECENTLLPTKEIFSYVEFICSSFGATILDPNGTVVPDQSDGNVYVSNENRITKGIIQNATLEDAGTYQCEHQSGSCQNFTVRIYILQFLQADSERRQIVQLRKTAVINCTVESHPMATIEWTFNNNRIYATSPEIGEKYINGTNLVIKRASHEDAGTYVCKAVLRSYVESKELTIQVDIQEGDLQCIQCQHSMERAADEDPCTTGDTSRLQTVSCFSKCITVQGKTAVSMSYFFIRDCGDILSEVYGDDRKLDQSELSEIQELYELDLSDPPLVGRLTVCATDKCNVRSDEYFAPTEATPMDNKGADIYPKCIFLTLCFLLLTYFI